MSAFWIVVGIILGGLTIVVFYEVLGKLKHNDKSWAFFVEAPFLTAMILCFSFLALSLLIESIFMHGPDTSHSSVFLKPYTWVNVTKEFFFAFVIAMFVIATVELHSRKEQKKFIEKATTDTQKSVFDAVYKSRVDPAVFEEAEKCIFNNAFIRVKHFNSMVLKTIAEHHDYILLSSVQDSRIRNISREEGPQGYTPQIYLPKPPRALQGKSNVDSVVVHEVLNGVRGRELRRYGGAQDIEKFKNSDARASPQEQHYKFESVSINPGQEIDIVIQITLVKERYDNEIWTTLVPTLEADVTVDSEVDGLDLGAISLHRGTMTLIGGEHGGRTRRWKIEKPMLPYQGYVVTWSKNDDESGGLRCGPAQRQDPAS